MIPGSSSAQFFGAAGAAGSGGYEISRSLRFNSSDSAYLSRTPASAGNRKTWTLSFWVKRGALTGSDTGIFSTYSGSNPATTGYFNASDGITFYDYTSSYQFRLITTQVFRDCSAWYHLAFVVDTTQATASDRIKLYVNGTQVTTFSTETYPPQNLDTDWNSTVEHQIGNHASYFNGYLADIHFIDGQALTPSSFGYTDTNGVWQPKAYAGTYGTNGFHLPFSDNSTSGALGTDTSGNGNDWTVYNLSADTGETSVAAASGALPINNTTDTYGLTIGSGVREDSSASSLVLAVPFTTAGSNGLTDDESPSGRTASTKTLTSTGSITSDSSKYKFYGSSASFSLGAYYSTTSSDFTFGTGDFTIECWVYNPSTVQGTLFATNTSSLATTTFNSRFYGSSGQLDVYTSGGAEYITISANPVDQWVHLAFCRSGNTMRVFVNGVLKATNNSWTHNISDGGNFYINKGRDTNTGTGQRYYQDVRVYKGFAKYTSSFSPPRAPDPVVGANCDSLVDSPTNYGEDTGAGGEVRGNYATWNPLYQSANSFYSDGNLKFTPNTGYYETAATTLHVGFKAYVEITLVTTGTYTRVGLLRTTTDPKLGSTAGYNSPIGAGGWATGSFGYTASTGICWVDAVNTYSAAAYTGGDTIGIAYDPATGNVYLWKNGVAQNSGAAVATLDNDYKYQFAITEANTYASILNTGQRPFAYTVPSGYKALCTQNLPTPTIADGSTAMDVALYTGNGTTQTISGLGFSPDLVWLKSRSNVSYHQLYDQIRGVQKGLYSNDTSAELTETTGLTAFGIDGFTLSSSVGVNGASRSYVAWAWDAGSSTVTNNDGSITAQVRANPSAGFSIVSWTGTGANGTIGHGLGVPPVLYISKARSATSSWLTLTTLIDGSVDYLYLDTTAAAASSGGGFATVPTSTVISLGATAGANALNEQDIMYCFAPVAGYSAFGTYEGNGSADGPFVYTGFRSRWLLIKRTSISGNNWTLYDTARSTYNQIQDYLYPSASVAEQTFSTVAVDVLANGFKARGTDTNINSSGSTYLYAAFAEHPFKTSRAR